MSLKLLDMDKIITMSARVIKLTPRALPRTPEAIYKSSYHKLV